MSSTRLLTNAIWNLSAFLIAIAANFLTIPLVIKAVGISNFGAAGLIIAVYAPFILIGATLNQSLLRQIAPLIAAGDYATSNRAVAATLRLCAVGCFAVAVLVYAFAEPFIRVATSHNGANVHWQLGFAIMLFGWAAQQFTFVIQAAVAATQRYSLVATISAIAAVANAGTIVVLVVYIPTFEGFLMGTSAGFAVALLVWLILVRIVQPWIFPLKQPTAADYRPLIHFGKWQASTQLVGALGQQMDRFVLGAIAPLAMVGFYNVAMRLQEVVHMGVLKTGEVLFPHFSVTANDVAAERAEFFLTASWAVNTFAACALAPLIALDSAIITLWIDAETAKPAAAILTTLATAGILGAGTNVFNYQIMGTGRNALLLRLTIFHAVLTMVLTVATLVYFGLAAAGYGILGANFVRLALVLIITGRLFSPSINFWTLMQCTFPPIAVGMVAAVYWWPTHNFAPKSWPVLLLEYFAVSCAVGVLSVTLTASTYSGRKLLQRVLAGLRPNWRVGT